MRKWANKEEESNIKETEVKVFRERLFCTEPGCDGEMLPNGWNWTMNPVGYHHDCNKCGKEIAVKGKSYPKIVYSENNG